MQEISVKDLHGGFNVAVIISRFNDEVTQALYQGALERLDELGFTVEQIKVVWVPGCVEIPLVAKKLAKTKKHDAIVCLGAVIRGQTSHYDYVCEQVSQGCQQVMMAYDLPVIFGVLTTENLGQAKDRCGGKKGHKGREAVDAAYEMVSVLQQL
jgi:6,7-dimethyl-8-ribityllumazine synthase